MVDDPQNVPGECTAERIDMRLVSRTYRFFDLMGVAEYYTPGTGWGLYYNDLPVSCHPDAPREVVAGLIQSGATQLRLRLEDRRNGNRTTALYTATDLYPDAQL